MCYTERKSRNGELDMAIMYLAKINLTAGIFDVYQKKLNLADVKATIYSEIDEAKSYKTTSGYTYSDELGNRRKTRYKSEYSFKELEKRENNIITGKLVRAFEKPTEKIDENGKIYQIQNQEMVSIYFYLDVAHELIAFSERQSFGYNQFMTAFSHILNDNSKNYIFEIFLQKDQDVLQEKIKNLKIVRSVKATLIPPNSNEKDLEEFKSSLQYLNVCEETNANKYKIEMSTSDDNRSLNVESQYMKEIYNAASRGYGEMTAHGINQNGKRQAISSNLDAALTRNINDNMSKYDYDSEAENFILEFLSRPLRKIAGERMNANGRR